MKKATKTKLVLRRLIIVFTSLAIILFSLLTLFRGTFIHTFAYKIAKALNVVIPEGEPGENINITFDNNNLFFKLSFLAIGFTLSLSIILFFWYSKIEKWKVKLITILLTIILMIVSTVNYSYHDRLWRLELQTLLDYINAYLGLVVLQYLLKVRAASEHSRALLWIIYFIVCMFGLILPFLFGTLYLLYRIGVPLTSFSNKWITAPAALISLLISWLSYKQKEREKVQGAS